MPADPLPCLTPRLRLRRFAAEDLFALQAYRRDPLPGRFQGWAPQSDADTAAWIRRMQTLPFCPPGDWFQLAIAMADDDRLIGEIGLRRHAARPHQAELSFTLDRAWHGQGLATEAVRAIVDLLWADSTLHRLLALADQRNVASMRLLQRLGMTRLRACQVPFRGETCTQWLHLLERPDRLAATRKHRLLEPSVAAAARRIG